MAENTTFLGEEKLLNNVEIEKKLSAKNSVLERKCGQYNVRVCFADKENPDTPQNVMNAITQAFRNRVERACNGIGDR